MHKEFIDGVGDYRRQDGCFNRMLNEHNGVKHGDNVSIDLLALTQVAEFMDTARSSDNARTKELALKDAHELLTHVIDNLKEV